MATPQIASKPSFQQERERTNRAGPPSPSDAQLRRLAVRRLKKRQEFRSHVFIYLGVNAMLWSIWVVGGIIDEWIFPWPIFPTIFWGLFVLGQANDLYWRDTFSEDQVQREIARLEFASRTRPLDTYDDEGDRWWPAPSRFGRGSRDNPS